MTRPLNSKRKLAIYFKEYLKKVMCSYKAVVLGEPEIMSCMELALNKLELVDKENELLTLREPEMSKIDTQAVERADNYEKMVDCLNKLAQWQDEEFDDADEPWAAEQARRVLDEIGVNKKI